MRLSCPPMTICSTSISGRVGQLAPYRLIPVPKNKKFTLQPMRGGRGEKISPLPCLPRNLLALVGGRLPIVYHTYIVTYNLRNL